MAAMAQRELTQFYPEPGSRGARPRRDLVHPARHRAPGHGAKLVSAPPTSPPSASTNQRETVVMWERAERASPPPRHRLAGSPHSAAPGRHAARRPRAPDPRADGTPARPVLLGQQDHLAPRSRPGRPGARRAWRAGRGHRRRVARQSPDSAGAVHVTDVSNASRTMLFDIRRGELGRHPPRALQGAAGAPARDPPQQRRGGRDGSARSSAARFPSPASPAISRRRCSVSSVANRAW